MKDTSIPTIVVNTEQQIDITFSPIPDNSPQFASENNSDAPINIEAESTQAQIEDQGYTYNQPGFTYNQPGWMYGGIYNQNQDLSPIFNDDTAYLISPSISGMIDMGTQGQRESAGMLMGVLGLTYPTDGVLF